ncbi:MAG: prevent-host-death family protein, partial [bacterium]
MQKQWKLQDAKNKFSEVVEHALAGEPQIVTRRGVEAVVVISVSDYKKMIQPKENLVDFIQNSPLHGIDLDID